MHQDHLAVCAPNMPRHWAVDCLNGLRPLIAETTPHAQGPNAGQVLASLDRAVAVFDADYARLGDAADVLFLPDVAAYGDRVTAVFERWAGAGPVLPVFWVHAVERFGLAPDDVMVRAGMMAALLAEVPNDLLYHGNEHYRKVMFHLLRLIATHRAAGFADMPVLEEVDILNLLLAATIHDLGHEGGDNLRDGIYTPGYMEQKAFDLMRPYLEALGIDRDMCGALETLVFCTDITFFAGDNSPCVRMKKIYRHYFTHDLPEGEDVESMMMGKLRRFEDNPKLSLMAMMLHEADIATSAGVSYEQSKFESINIAVERGANAAGPANLLKFLVEQMGATLYSPAARMIFLNRMETIMQQAAQDLESGAGLFEDAAPSSSLPS